MTNWSTKVEQLCKEISTTFLRYKTTKIPFLFPEFVFVKNSYNLLECDFLQKCFNHRILIIRNAISLLICGNKIAAILIRSALATPTGKVRNRLSSGRENLKLPQESLKCKRPLILLVKKTKIDFTLYYLTSI